MKKKMLFSAILLSGVFALSSFKNNNGTGGDDEYIIIPANQNCVVNGVDIPHSPIDYRILICPGNGASCSVTITTGGTSTVYNGSKAVGGPDVIIEK